MTHPVRVFTSTAALVRLERFLDRSLDIIDRVFTLDDEGIGDDVVIAFLETIPSSFRLEALTLSNRQAVHSRWAGSRIIEDREAIACNFAASVELQLLLATDPEEAVRAALATST